ncbi:hypothetical protein EF847_06030 [Actinobacteria bacterium YIM 96077]|uniref:Uncharacterized protein n=1 Tax=Phytoactinopolyspora halophila TaxID=1981511 RepID=A0A329QPU6_9ACTN|nr:hypothetical protein [Phytoactinopolyspora halophila]AYY12333.1 hypothetical protein EF847_06030 [Actinobacteria bacterium YIM 96077]RAW13749.1 hypothetical protein DPM12_12125 [Phytoactinopolyspora halophila]
MRNERSLSQAGHAGTRHRARALALAITTATLAFVVATPATAAESENGRYVSCNPLDVYTYTRVVGEGHHRQTVGGRNFFDDFNHSSYQYDSAYFGFEYINSWAVVTNQALDNDDTGATCTYPLAEE